MKSKRRRHRNRGRRWAEMRRWLCYPMTKRGDEWVRLKYTEAYAKQLMESGSFVSVRVVNSNTIAAVMKVPIHSVSMEVKL